MRYVVNTDGGSRGNPGPAGYGFVVRGADGVTLAERAGYLGHATNNVAEYTAVAAALELIAAADPGARVEVRADSKLVVEQLSDRWKIKHPALQEIALRARRALAPRQVSYTWVPREQNKDADALANRAMDEKQDVARGEIRAVATDQPAGGAPTQAPAPRAPAPQPAGEPEPPAGTMSVGRPGRKPSGAAIYTGAHRSVNLVFVRHGETAMTVSNGYSGGSEPGPRLSPKGRDQAARVARLIDRVPELWTDLPAPSVVWASPMVRTQETAEVVASRLGLAIETVEDLREVDFGQWQGLTAPEIREQFGELFERWHASADVRAPAGESTRDVAERVGSVARRALREHQGETVVLVCHSVVTKAGLGSLTGLPPDSWQWVRVPPASVSIVRLWPDACEVVVAGLPSELASDPPRPPTLF